MSDWKEIKLGEVVEISNGYGFKGTDLSNSCQLLQPHDIVLQSPANSWTRLS